MTVALSLGYIPLVDAAPLIIAAEFGFAEEEGLALDLVPASSWSMLRDMLDFGVVVGAQMLSVVPVARALGLGGGKHPMEAAMVLSLNGQVFGLSGQVATALGGVAFGDPVGVGKGLKGPLRIGVPFPFSMQAELLHFWLAHTAPGVTVDIRTVPPPQMARALLQDDIDGFCVGEPWGSHAVETAGARLVFTGSAIWSQAPEKVLATRSGWAEERPDLAGSLLRALWRAGRWLSLPQNRMTTAEVLSRTSYLDVPADLIDRALTGRLLAGPSGPEVAVDQFLALHHGVANFPWRSQASWIGTRLATRFGLPLGPAVDAARRTFRSDLYRQHLAALGAPLPRSSDKAEGALMQDEVVAAMKGSLILARNRFFNGQVFDPALTH